MMNVPAINEIYRDNKGRDYEIVTLATDADKGDRVVVYRSYKGSDTYVLTLDKFQNGNRFVKVDITEVEMPTVDPRLEAFIDARSTSEKLEILRTMKEDATDVMLTVMGTYLDMDLENKSRDDKYNAIKNSLLMKQQYEGGRLRD